MNYIFYDIECANCQNGQAKICSFGYVVTDESFNVLEKRDVVINPRAPFLLMGRGRKQYIKLAYSMSQFRSAPDFADVYGRIRALLTRRDCLIFGYAADNDAGYLKSEFERFHLPSIDFAYYDLQKLLNFVLPKEEGQPRNQISLTSAVGMLCGEEPSQEIHKSDDDALLTMQVLKGIAEKTGVAPVKLLERYPVCRGDLSHGQVLVRIPEGPNLIVRVLGDKSDRISPKSENRTIYVRYVRHVKPSGAIRPQWLKGKRVGIPEKYAERHFKNAVRLISLICDCGGKYTLIPEECQYFITFPVYDDTGAEKISAEQLRILEKRPISRAKFLTPEQFFAACRIDAEEFEKTPVPDLTYLLDERYAPKSKKAAQEPSRRTPPVKKDRTVVIIPDEEDD
ncbi:MAG: hypothetical protein IJU52_09940 [Clostridia bacterium]|nr:hypothetical protein [Clostridia bacterium]